MNMKKLFAHCYSALIWDSRKRRAVRRMLLTNDPIDFVHKHGKIKTFLMKLVSRITLRARLRNFEVHIVEHCNLGCQCCNHYSSIAEESFLDLETFEKDFTRMASLTNSHVEFINLLGGEPLLHPRLIEFFPIARRLFPRTRIQLITNGILLSKQSDKFWEACRQYGITICITNYPIDINRDLIEEKVECYGIDLVYWDAHLPRKITWYEPLDLLGKQNPKTNFLKCGGGNNCIFLREGKLFTCVVPPNVHHFNKFFRQNVEVCDEDFIDIYKVNNIDEILRFLAQPIPFCRYCNVDNRKHIRWQTTKKKIEEWT